MSVFTVLGATGSVGSSVLQVLLQSPERKINVYVRSKSKLLSQQPNLESNQQVKIFEGSLDDIGLLANCMSDAKAVFLTVAASQNIPGCSISKILSQQVIKGLHKIRERNPQAKMPKLIVLSSASLNEKFCSEEPPLAHWLIWRAAYYIYIDLQEGEKFLREQEDWVSSVFVKPGGLVVGEQRGHELSTERSQTFLSFLDLAGGMVEIADTEGDRWDMKDVSVVPTSKQVKVNYWIPLYLIHGLLAYYLPWTYPYLSRWTPAG